MPRTRNGSDKSFASLGFESRDRGIWFAAS